MIDKIKHVLGGLGLTNNEISIYTLLIKAPGIYATSTISKKLNLNRITTYKSLIKLCKMNLLIKTMKHGVISFMAEEPGKKIEKFLSREKAKLESVSSSFLEILPQIESFRNHQITIPRMRYHEGIEGMKRVYEDTLLTEGDIYVFKNVDYANREIYDYLVNEYIPKRNERNIHAYAILPENEVHKKWQSESTEVKRKIKFFPKKLFPLEIEIIIYGKKVAFFSYHDEEAYAVILEDLSIRNSMKVIFDICWKAAK